LTRFGLGGLTILFLALDAVTKLINVSEIQESIVRLGYALSLDRTLGLIELVCVALYVVPRTSAFGGTLLTALFGEDINLGGPVDETDRPKTAPTGSRSELPNCEIVASCVGTPMRRSSLLG
jgi:hypothetical protein